VRKEDIVDIVNRVPERDHQKVQFITKTGMQLNVESFARFEPTYVVFRGREGGQTDEGRGFFVPYDDIVFLKIERSVKLSELKSFYGEVVAQELDLSKADFPSDSAPTQTPLPAPVAAPASKSAPLDPTQIAKQNLLARIRAARNAAGVGNNS
jgi:hypothetical protein